MKNTPIRYTLFYVVFVTAYTAIYCIQNNHIALLDSAGLGNFLSGFFAPLAFLYLFLGFRQQEKALIKNQEYIAEQLKLQKLEREEREFISLPLITITNSLSMHNALNLQNINSLEDFLKNNQAVLTIYLDSLTQDAYYFNCDLISPTPLNQINTPLLNKSNKLRFWIDLNSILGSSEQVSKTLYFKNSYLSSIGILYEHDFEITISIDKNNGLTDHLSQIGGPTKVIKNT